MTDDKLCYTGHPSKGYMYTFPAGVGDYRTLSPEERTRLIDSIRTRLKRPLLLASTVHISLMEFLGSIGFFMLYDERDSVLPALFASGALGVISYAEDPAGPCDKGQFIKDVCEYKIKQGFGTQLAAHTERQFADRLAHTDITVLRIDQRLTELKLHKRLIGAFSAFVKRVASGTQRDEYYSAASVALPLLSSANDPIPTSHLGDILSKATQTSPRIQEDTLNYLKTRMVREMADQGGLMTHLDPSMVPFESHMGAMPGEPTLADRFARSESVLNPFMCGLSHIIDAIDWRDIPSARSDANWVALRQFLTGERRFSKAELKSLYHRLANQHVQDHRLRDHIIQRMEDYSWVFGYAALIAETATAWHTNPTGVMEIVSNTLQVAIDTTYAIALVGHAMRIRQRISAQQCIRDGTAAEAIRTAASYPEVVLYGLCRNMIAPISGHEISMVGGSISRAIAPKRCADSLR